MTFFLIALLLQFQLALPDRATLQSPAIGNPVPRQVQKDYDKLWKRFLAGKEDAKVTAEFDKLLKKNPDALSALIVQAYIDLYSGRQKEAERRLETVLAKRPSDSVALFYLGELAYGRGDFVRANEMFTRLGTNAPAPDVDMKRQRSLLLAMEGLLQSARQAANDNRLAEAERFYRQALRLAPDEAVLHGQLAEVLRRAGKSTEAQTEIRLQEQLRGTGALQAADNELAVTGLEELGRWTDQIERFREIQVSKAITREQLAALFAGYFPELMEVRQTSEIMTDVQSSWAAAAILKVVGAGVLESTANHTFQPSRAVSRGEFALALARLSRVLGLSATGGASIAPLDVVPGSTLYVELQPVLGYGLLSLDNAGNFNIAAHVRGEEAVNTAEKLLALIHKKTR